ncbi:hypothetical protein [uncultured Endozoicomonas sp.]|uniref:hypothetical protein n=1 Tax=uncultured Endozoicomonas sp. TaxID=432652 RepID=UPI00260C3E93|nr:hypothetical protein [uncultured Endozoicomonas sp.]
MTPLQPSNRYGSTLDNSNSIGPAENAAVSALGACDHKREDSKPWKGRFVRHKFSYSGPVFKKAYCNYKCQSLSTEVAPSVKTHEGCNPLHETVLRRDMQKVEELTASDSQDINCITGRIVDHFRPGNTYLGSEMTPLQLIIYYGDDALLDVFLSAAKKVGKEVNFDHKFYSYQVGGGRYNTALAMVAKNKDYDMIQTLVSNGFDLSGALVAMSDEFDLWGESGFIAALFNSGILPGQMVDDVPLLLKVARSCKEGIPADCLRLFYETAKEKDALEAVFIRNRDKDKSQNTFEYYAAQKNETGLTKLLSFLETENVDFLSKCLNSTDDQGQTLLHLLCRNFHYSWPYQKHDPAELSETVRMTARLLLYEEFSTDLILKKTEYGSTAIDLLHGNCEKEYAGNYVFPEDHQIQMVRMIAPPHEEAVNLCNKAVGICTELLAENDEQAQTISVAKNKLKEIGESFKLRVPIVRKHVCSNILFAPVLKEADGSEGFRLMGMHHNVFIALAGLSSALPKKHAEKITVIKSAAEDLVLQIDEFEQQFGCPEDSLDSGSSGFGTG